ncbi:hypothetical protein CDL12_10721 [Handroanthus impetiginosus]|uniref:Uncharacterized protein n=1 Tax=Handroanthus impetiginosus TaxID=429701 RepID=A0A2G9HH56_9LAMI|nr:hypothetical protein CDL12_10721 [Handroanthus impetiginosus]
MVLIRSQLLVRMTSPSTSRVVECQNMIQGSLRTPMVKLLKEHLEKSGCSIGNNFIKAVHCKGPIAGGYLSGEGIRAGHLSGDYHYKRQLCRGFLKIRGHEQVNFILFHHVSSHTNSFNFC